MKYLAERSFGPSSMRLETVRDSTCSQFGNISSIEVPAKIPVGAPCQENPPPFSILFLDKVMFEVVAEIPGYPSCVILKSTRSSLYSTVESALMSG